MWKPSAEHFRIAEFGTRSKEDESYRRVEEGGTPNDNPRSYSAPSGADTICCGVAFLISCDQEVTHMNKIILDAATQAKLNGLTESLELHDEAGNLIGYILPPEAYAAMGLMPAQPPFTDAEIEEAMKNSGTGRPLEDILKDHGYS